MTSKNRNRCHFLIAGLALFAILTSAAAAGSGRVRAAQKLLLLENSATASVAGFNNFTGANLAQYFSAAAAVSGGSRNGTIMALGDSTTLGVGSTGSGFPNSISNGYPAQLSALMGFATDSMMDNVGGTTFSALQTFDSRVTGTAANWFGQNFGLIGNIWQPSSTTPFTFTPTNQIDTVEIRTAVFSGGSATPFLANFDGGTDTSISNINASPVILKTVLSTTLGLHAINIRVASATLSATQQFASFVAYNSAVKKFNMLNCGANGAKAADLDTAGAWNALSQITNWPADLVIIMIGINDWANGTSLSSYSTSLNTLISAAKAGGSSVIVMSPVPSNSTITAYATQATYVAAMKAAALAAGVPFIDLWNLAGGTWNTGIPMSDNLHPTATGYGLIAGYAKTGLTPGFISK